MIPGDSFAPDKDDFGEKYNDDNFEITESGQIDPLNNEPTDSDVAIANGNLNNQHPGHELAKRLDSAVRE